VVYSECMVLGICLRAHQCMQWWCSAWSWVRIFDILGVNGGVVHVVGSNLSPLGVNGGVVHGRGFESLTFGSMVVGSNLLLLGCQWWCRAWSRVRIFDFWGVNGGVVHGGFFDFLGVNGGVVHCIQPSELHLLYGS
jgi:hypothetical protein